MVVALVIGLVIVVVDAVIALKWLRFRGGQRVALVHGHAEVVPCVCGGWFEWCGVGGEGENVSKWMIRRKQ